VLLKIEHRQGYDVKKIIFLVIVCIALSGYSNPLVSWYRKPAGQIYYTVEAPAGFKSDEFAEGDKNPTVTLQQFSAIAGVPLILTEEYMVVSGINIKVNDFKFNDIENVDITTYSISIPIVAAYKINENFKIMANLSAGIHSDFKEITIDDFKFSWFGICTYSISDSVNLYGGLAYNRSFGKDTLFPVVGLDWKINDEWFLNLAFPRPFIAYQASDSLLFYAGIGPAGGEWNVENPLDSEDDENYNFYFSGYRVGGGVEYDINKHITMYLNVGSTMLRDYEIKNDNRTLLDTKVDNTFIGIVGFAIFP
jgi:hypothetical protein